MTTPVPPTAVDPTAAAPHLAVPFALAADGAAAVVDQDSLADVTQCVRVLLATERGSRPDAPGYGIDDPTFAGLDPAEVTRAVAEWEPRADVTVTVAAPPASTLTVTVAVRTSEGA